MGNWKEDSLNRMWMDICNNSNIARMEYEVNFVLPSYNEAWTLISFLGIILSVLIKKNVGISRSGALLVGKEHTQLVRFQDWENKLRDLEHWYEIADAINSKISEKMLTLSRYRLKEEQEEAFIYLTNLQQELITGRYRDSRLLRRLTSWEPGELVE